MILGVRHTTRYRFGTPRRSVTQSLRLTPAASDGQKVLDWSIVCEGGNFGQKIIDGAGDTVQTLTLIGPLEEAEIDCIGRVETQDNQGVLKGHREKCPPLAYLRDTRLTSVTHEIRDFAAAALEAAGDDALGRAHALAAAVTDEIEYTPGATHAATTAAEVLADGQGVCQDHTHLLIASALASGIPARYVSGYLYTDHEMGEASHAWAELHVPGLGWVGFDPANSCCPDERYIRLGSGLDAVGAAPIRGLTDGIGEEELDVAVQVTQSQQQ